MAPLKVGNYRWRIVALLFLATTINYIDRQVLSFVMTDELFKKTLLGLPVNSVLTQAHIQEFKIQMGFIDSAFKATYAFGFLLAGWLIDRVGTKKGLSLGMFIWSLAGLASAFVSTAFQFTLVRAILGLGESANFPAAIKTVAEWFPRKERSLANGILNAASNMGVIATALLIPYTIHEYGWRPTFIFTGLLGVAMLVIWWFTYSRPEENKILSPAEYQYIIDADPADSNAAPSTVKLHWRELLRYRQTWAFAAGKIFADPVWFFYLTWLPDFFMTNAALEEKLDLKNFGIPFLVIYLVSDLGSMFFGWLSTYFMQRGWSENKARKITLLLCALLVTPIYFASSVHSIYTVIALLALATAAHQGWSTNVFSLASNLFPSGSVASVTGIGGMLGGLTSMVVAAVTGLVVAYLGYKPMFIFASCSYLIGLLVMHLMLPRFHPITVNSTPKTAIASQA